MRLAPLFVGGWCAVLFLYGLDAGPLYRTESLRAVIGRECLHGHWLYPVLYGEPFLTKPPGHYAAIGLCSLPFGEVSAATARLPSAVAALCAVVLVYGMFRRALGDGAARLAAVLLPCSVLWLDKVPSAEIDMTLVGWVTAAIVFVHRALDAGRHGALLWIGALLCVAGGALTKWTAPAFFYLTLVPLLVWRGQVGLLFGWRHLLAVGVAGLVCAAWALAVVQQVGWDALVETIRKEAAYRFAPKAGKGYPWGDVVAYPLAVIAAHLPVAGFAALTFRPSFWAALDERGKRLLQLLHCWTWPNLLFWTLVPNHNVRYALPMSAGLMGLGVVGLWAWWRDRADASPQPTPPEGERGNSGEASSACRDGLELRRTFPSLSPGGGGLGSARGRSVVAFLVCWLGVKIAFVEVVVQNRTADRHAGVAAAELRRHVPDGQPLHVFLLKDEGVTFYYARPVRKLADPRALPAGAFALLIRREREDGAAFGHLELVSCMRDQQGDPIYLVRNP